MILKGHLALQQLGGDEHRQLGGFVHHGLVGVLANLLGLLVGAAHDLLGLGVGRGKDLVGALLGKKQGAWKVWGAVVAIAGLVCAVALRIMMYTMGETLFMLY